MTSRGTGLLLPPKSQGDRGSLSEGSIKSAEVTVQDANLSGNSVRLAYRAEKLIIRFPPQRTSHPKPVRAGYRA